MSYALNIKKGTEIIHPEIGLLESGVARLIPDDLVNTAKHLKGVIVFEEIAGMSIKRKQSIADNLYGKDIEELKSELENSDEEELKYEDFFKKYKDKKKASKKWKEYKEKHGIV